MDQELLALRTNKKQEMKDMKCNIAVYEYTNIL